MILWLREIGSEVVEEADPNYSEAVAWCLGGKSKCITREMEAGYAEKCSDTTAVLSGLPIW